MLPLDVIQFLQKADLVPALAWAKQWLLTASYRDIRQLVSSCPPKLREHLVALLEDVLADHPTTTWGLPCLMRFQDSEGGSLHLPLPEHAAPDPRITRMAWLSLSTLTDDKAFGVPAQNVFVSGDGQIHCAVLLCQTAGPSEPVIADSWWPELLSEAITDNCRLQLSSRMLLPWPSAVEAAAALHKAATTGAEQGDTPRLFLAEDAYLFARKAGVEWRRLVQVERL